MARYKESKLLARAIRRNGIDLVGAHGQKVVMAVVRQVSPLAVELVANDIVIEDDHLLLGASTRLYDQAYGIKVGDTVLVSRLANGDWFVFDVVTDADIAPATRTLAWARAMLTLGASVVVAAGDGPALQFNSADVSDDTCFEWRTVDHPNDRLAFLKNGIYFGYAATEWEAANFPHYAHLETGALSNHGIHWDDGFTTRGPSALGTWWTVDTAIYLVTSAPEETFLRVFNADSVDRSVTNATFSAIYLGAA